MYMHITFQTLCIYIYVFCVLTYLFYNKMCFDNANGIHVVERAESFRTQQSQVTLVLQMARYGRFCFGNES